jgi:ABC-2 type transport system ATP-binding protein
LSSPKKDPALKFESVTKTYGSRAALSNVSLELGAQGFYGLLGPNGAGKSTLFQIAAGLFAPDAGSVEIFGCTYRRQRAIILRQLGVVFQSRSIDLDMSVEANLRFHGRLFGLSGAELLHAIDRVLTLLDIADKRKRLVRAMSGGEQRRVEVARALLNEPKLVLMDEASAGLDTQARRALVAHMKAISDQTDTTVLWATHLVDELDHADQVIVLISGRVRANASPAELVSQTESDTLTDAYVAITDNTQKA